MTQGREQKFLMLVSDMARWYAGTAFLPQWSQLTRAPVNNRLVSRTSKTTNVTERLFLFLSCHLRHWRSEPWRPSHSCCCRTGWQSRPRCFCCPPSPISSARLDTWSTAALSCFSVLPQKKQTTVKGVKLNRPNRKLRRRRSHVMLKKLKENKLVARGAHLGLSYLLVFGQAGQVAQSFAGSLQPQRHWLSVAEGATVRTGGHWQVVRRAETGEAEVAAEFVHGLVQDHLVFTLERDGDKKKKQFKTFIKVCPCRQTLVLHKDLHLRNGSK